MPVSNYIWDVENDSYLAQTDDNGDTTAVYTNEPVQYGRLISQRRGNDTSYYHFDGIGSTRALTNTSQVVTDTNLFDAWGVNVASSGTADNPFRFVGEVGYYHDPDNSKYYTRARTFEPVFARWTTPDHPAFITRFAYYVYALNRPLIYDDPSGLIEATTTPAPPPKPVPPSFPRPCPTIKDRHRFASLQTGFKMTERECREIRDELSKRYGIAKAKIVCGFVQRVTIKVTVTAGTSRELNTDTCNDPCPPECNNCLTYEHTSTFNEMFKDTNKDNHSFVYSARGFAEFNKCKEHTFNRCCAWTYRIDVIKEVTGGHFVARGTAYLGEFKESTDCCGTLFPNDKAKPWGSVPDLGKPPPIPEMVKFPDPPVTNVLRCTRSLSIQHSKCGDAVVSLSFSDYKEVSDDNGDKK